MASKDPRPCKGDAHKPFTREEFLKRLICPNCEHSSIHGKGKCAAQVGYELAEAAGIHLRGGEAA